MTARAPASWVEASLADLAIQAQSGFPSGRHNSEGVGIPHLRPMNIDRLGHIDLAEVKDVEPDRDLRIAAGDVLFNNTNSPALIGKTAYFDRAGEWAFSNHMTRLRPPAGIEAKFLALQLHHLWNRGLFQQLCSHHVNQASVATKVLLGAVRVVVPPTAEQRRIVAAIEEHFSRLDDADESLRRAHRRLLKLKAALLAAALEGWPEPTLGEFAEVFVGTTPSRSAPELWEGDVPWVSSGEVAFCRIRRTRETISPAAVTSADRLHPPGTVLLAMIGEGKTRGQAAILDVAATHNQNSAAIRLDSQLCTPEWLFYVLIARYEVTRRAGSGAQQPALNRARVVALKIPLPPLEDQGRLVDEIERQLSLSDTLTGGIDRTSRRTAALRRSILEQAFSGKLVPQDPSDEPASVLLERIEAERAAAPKPSRRKSKIPT